MQKGLVGALTFLRRLISLPLFLEGIHQFLKEFSGFDHQFLSSHLNFLLVSLIKLFADTKTKHIADKTKQKCSRDVELTAPPST